MLKVAITIGRQVTITAIAAVAHRPQDHRASTVPFPAVAAPAAFVIARLRARLVLLQSGAATSAMPLILTVMVTE